MDTARIRAILSKPAVIAGAGLAATTVYAFLSLFLIPLPSLQVDTEHFRHFVSANFAYASSIFDLSVSSPFQGMGGLVQPLGVWLNPSYVLPHFLTAGNPSVWSYIPAILMMMAATFLLGRAMGLPVYLAVIGAQLVAVFSFHPMFQWARGTLRLNGVLLYSLVPAIAVPAAVIVTWLALFSYLGRLSTRWNIACIALIPVVFIYGVQCDPLYTALFIPPFALLAVGIYLGSGSKSVFIWRSVGGAVLLAVAVVLRVPQFYRGLSGYAARAVFPNELYSEVQQWDYLTGLLFQGGLMTPLMLLMMAGCLLTIWRGTAQARGFAAAVLLFAVGMIGVNLAYVYGGTRWSLPLPIYFETGVQPAYMVAGLLGVWHFSGKTAGVFRGSRWAKSGPGATPGLALTAVYAAIFLIPLLGTMFVWKQKPPYNPAFNVMPRESAAPTGIVAVLKENLAIAADGRFRGSVANLAGVPGGNTSRYPESFPFTKDQIGYLLWYLRSFDPHYYMTGFWELGIPTLEDNNQLVTPPFHFLVSRALSRPQDFHSRNWAWITQANPRLMAALGTRYILADRQLSDPLLNLRQVQTNGEGKRVGLYEIQDPNVGNYSPTATLLSTDATQALSLMASGKLSFRDTAVVHDAELPGLVRANSGEFFYERGGVRVRATSRGTSLLVLPIQFSNSLRVVAAESGAGAPIRLIRVNLLETGVLFTGTINVKIAHVFGLFRDVKGRLRDIEDYKRLGIRETGVIPYPPGYQPLGGTWPLIGGMFAKKGR